MKIRTVLLVTVVPLLLVFTACMSLGTSTSTATRFYMMESRVDTSMSAGSQAGLADLSVGIGPVTIPAYLDRPQLVTRMSGNELRLDEFHQWAEPLTDTISRVIQENLSVLSGARRVYSYPIRRDTVIDYQISLDVLRFDADAEGGVTLKTLWRIVNPDEDQRLVVRRSTILQPSGSTDTADVVDAMSMALAALSQEMVKALVDVARQ